MEHYSHKPILSKGLSGKRLRQTGIRLVDTKLYALIFPYHDSKDASQGRWRHLLMEGEVIDSTFPLEIETLIEMLEGSAFKDEVR